MSGPVDFLNAALARLRNAVGDSVPVEMDGPAPYATWPAGRLVVAPGQTIGSAWGNTTYDQTVNTFASAADRDNQWPTPHEGSVCYLNDVKRPYIYRNAAWVPFDLRCSRYKFTRTAAGVPAGSYVDIGIPPNNEWANGSQQVGASSTITMLKPALVTIVATWGIGTIASGAAAAGEIAALGRSLGSGFIYPLVSIQGSSWFLAPSWSSVMNTGETIQMRVRNSSAAAFDLTANTWVSFADVSTVTIQ